MSASALRHGWSEEDVRWAVAHALASFHVRTRQPEAVAGLLHLGPARTTYRRLLEERRR